MQRGDQRLDELTAVADQHEDVLGAHRPAARRQPQRRLGLEPRRDLPRQLVRHADLRRGQPLLLGHRQRGIVLGQAEWRPQCHITRPRAARGSQRWHRIGRTELVVAKVLDDLVDDFQHGGHGAEGLGQRDVAPFQLGIADDVAEMDLTGVEDPGVGALEAEDRLLEVADDEQRPLQLARALAAEELVGQRLDDLPLRGIGVLRLVHQHVVDARVELEAHPFAHARAGQQLGGAGDHVVVIDDPGAALVRGIGAPQPRADAEVARGVGGGL